MRSRRVAVEIAQAVLAPVTVHHDVAHLIRYEPMPRPTLVYAEIANGAGEIWRLTPMMLGRGQDNVLMPGFPISWLTGRSGDHVLGQSSIRLRFEYRP